MLSIICFGAMLWLRWVTVGRWRELSILSRCLSVTAIGFGTAHTALLLLA